MFSEPPLLVVIALVGFGCMILAAGLAGMRFATRRWAHSFATALVGVVVAGTAVGWIETSGRPIVADWDPPVDPEWAEKWANHGPPVRGSGPVHFGCPSNRDCVRTDAAMSAATPPPDR